MKKTDFWPKVVAFGLPIGDFFYPKIKSLLMGCDKSYLLRFPCGNILTLERPYLIDGRKTIPTLTSFELFNKRRKYLKIFSKHQQLNLQTLKAHEILESRILPIDCPFLNLVEKLPSTITRDSPSVDLY